MCYMSLTMLELEAILVLILNCRRSTVDQARGTGDGSDGKSPFIYYYNHLTASFPGQPG